MSASEKQLLVGQLSLIEQIRKAGPKCAKLAEECDRLGLPILARELGYYATELPKKIDLQIRSFREGALQSEGPSSDGERKG